jgi:hypothetical protein
MANKKPEKKAEKKRIHVDTAKGRVSVDVNKSGTVGIYMGGGGKPKTHDNPKGEKHGEIGVRITFGGSKKGKK